MNQREKSLRSIKTKSKSKESQNIDIEETLPNPNFYWGEDTFTLENGDSYSGEYCCHKTGIIWREGNGTYVTKDGHIYEGIWENDQLLYSPESKITYPSNDKYEGSIIDGKYNGKGTYTFKDQLSINATFKDNKPIDEMYLMDYEDHIWKGKSEENSAILLCTNNFYDILPEWRGVGEEVIIDSTENERDDDIKIGTQPSEPSLNELERIYFKKSSKTKNNFDHKIFHKPSTNRQASGKTVKDLISGEIIKNAKDSSQVSLSLLKMFLSRSWREKSKPMSIFIPTMDYEEIDRSDKGIEVNMDGLEPGLSEIEIENVVLN